MSPERVIKYCVPGITLVRMASLYVLVEAVLIVFIGALRGAGDTLWAMAMSASLHWMMVVVLWFMLKVIGTSPQAGWSAIVFFFLLFSGLVFLRYRTGQWKNIKVVHPEPVTILPDEAFHEGKDL